MNKIGTTICALALSAFTALAGCSKEAPKRANYDDINCLRLSSGRAMCAQYDNKGNLQILRDIGDGAPKMCLYTEGNKQYCRNRNTAQMTPEQAKAADDAIKAMRELQYQTDKSWHDFVNPPEQDAEQ